MDVYRYNSSWTGYVLHHNFGARPQHLINDITPLAASCTPDLQASLPCSTLDCALGHMYSPQKDKLHFLAGNLELSLPKQNFLCNELSPHEDDEEFPQDAMKDSEVTLATTAGRPILKSKTEREVLARVQKKIQLQVRFHYNLRSVCICFLDSLTVTDKCNFYLPRIGS